MSEKTLFLAWKDRGRSEAWFPVGRLDAAPLPEPYRFRYIRGAERATEEAGFPPVMGFPHLKKDYRSPQLFSLFQNRVIASGRPDRSEYLRHLDLEESAGPMDILSVSGGRRVTDPYAVFPKLEKHADGTFSCRFLLLRCHAVSDSARDRIDRLVKNENLHLGTEPSDPANTQPKRLAVPTRTEDGQTIGWAPHYLVRDMIDASVDYTVRVVRVNPPPAMPAQRVLVEMKARFENGYAPMTGEDYTPLVE